MSILALWRLRELNPSHVACKAMSPALVHEPPKEFMAKIVVSCLTCCKPFHAETREVNRGNAKYCTKDCFYARPQVLVEKEPNFTCAWCSRPFYRSPSSAVNSRSGLSFCCRVHKDQAQQIGGLQEIQPAHYSKQLTNYRKVAAQAYDQVCCECEYDKVPEILEVHHVDHDRTNNSATNLRYLCPNCHQEHHFATKSGRFA